MNKFEYVVNAFKEEPTIEQLNNTKGWNDKSHKKYTAKGISTHVFTNNNSVKLQFLGWELVLSSDGSYYINDTSGG
jgi:hypothetical protein